MLERQRDEPNRNILAGDNSCTGDNAPLYTDVDSKGCLNQIRHCQSKRLPVSRKGAGRGASNDQGHRQSIRNADPVLCCLYLGLCDAKCWWGYGVARLGLCAGEMRSRIYPDNFKPDAHQKADFFCSFHHIADLVAGFRANIVRDIRLVVWPKRLNPFSARSFSSVLATKTTSNLLNSSGSYDSNICHKYEPLADANVGTEPLVALVLLSAKPNHDQL